ncbi:Protein translocase subunit YajC [Bathymodiolus thermophilus thioautotrophic gill symbiont]|jgi:preprotein translocase subunit YajC|uniref:Sec translocon accessory complex subunit YajC n=3 Tax=sulfur-oxidizing symbionts TaxID=32036 RepID=A0A1H6MC41_9GAMM|nr:MULTISPECIES: preprotein translocase subunit YajC [Gammaproteobacteria]CAC5835003.1 Protein translocase subunit YajC [uncultured Gammaproteobacteria bacterium]CAB5503408.1 Protein translocase subunit YajC [Bathymodiolus azoricus thioautotrophic gill symbiont]CAB5508007.1 Protein translocase subunit YajC [Bathymodiolus thermophilus thioautotrophic gill symbiont]CAC9497006.1 Protein translocase subunit YajC [uncultured Gammaproteobacteria bacterium]CAC9516638.1 Protein translocase subunit Yaj
MNLLDLIISPAHAAEGINSDPSALNQLIPLVLLFVVMYFLLIRPQQKRAKAHKALLGALKAGDEIVTNGGIVGTVKSVDESFATVEIASGVVVKVQKQGINQKMPKGSTKA